MAFASGFASESTLTGYEVAHPPVNKASRVKQNGVKALTETVAEWKLVDSADAANQTFPWSGPKGPGTARRGHVLTLDRTSRSERSANSKYSGLANCSSETFAAGKSRTRQTPNLEARRITF